MGAKARRTQRPNRRDIELKEISQRTSPLRLCLSLRLCGYSNEAGGEGAFEFEEGLFHREAAAEAGEGAVAGDDAVAGEPEGDGVRANHGADGARGLGLADSPREPPVAAGFAAGDFAEGEPGFALDGRAGREVDGKVIEACVVAGGVAFEEVADLSCAGIVALNSAKRPEFAGAGFAAAMEEGGVADAVAAQGDACPAHPGVGNDGGQRRGRVHIERVTLVAGVGNVLARETVHMDFMAERRRGVTRRLYCVG